MRSPVPGRRSGKACGLSPPGLSTGGYEQTGDPPKPPPNHKVAGSGTDCSAARPGRRRCRKLYGSGGGKRRFGFRAAQAVGPDRELLLQVSQHRGLGRLDRLRQHVDERRAGERRDLGKGRPQTARAADAPAGQAAARECRHRITGLFSRDHTRQVAGSARPGWARRPASPEPARVCERHLRSVGPGRRCLDAVAAG